jgi:hypothetical protein
MNFQFRPINTLENLRSKRKFFCDESFELVFKFSLTTIVGEQTREIFDGQTSVQVYCTEVF